MKSHKEAKTPGKNGLPRPMVATMVRPWYSLVGAILISRSAAFCVSLCIAGLALEHPSWAYWASFANFLDLVWPNLHAFLLTLGSLRINLQSKLEQAESKHNQRNMSINQK